MGIERLNSVADAGTQLAKSILADEQTVRALITYCSDKSIVVNQVAAVLKRLNSDEQAGFLKTLFQNMAKENMASEGDAEITNRRDTALAILTDTANNDVRLTEGMIPFVKANLTVVYDAYKDAVGQQTRDNDPVSGSIDTLLQAGKAIAPYLSQLKKAKKREITRKWGEVVRRFPTLEERIPLRLQIAEIKSRMFWTW